MMCLSLWRRDQESSLQTATMMDHTWRAAVRGDHYVTGIVPGAGTD